MREDVFRILKKIGEEKSKFKVKVLTLTLLWVSIKSEKKR